MAWIDYDWICIDCQHGLIGYAEMRSMLQAVDTRGLPSLVRVGWNDSAEIMRALDAGAHGVIVPMVSSAAEAEAAARACRYPPEGYRSFGPVRASLGYSDYTPASANRKVVCIPMIETVDGVDAIDAILSVPGVDGVFVGPWDLSLSATGGLEAPGQTPRDRELIGRVLESAQRVGSAVGIACMTLDQARYWRSEGVRMMVLGSDLSILTQQASALAEAFRAEG